MTPDIKAIKAAAEAATPGPWVEAGPSYGEPKPRFFNSVVTDEDEDGDWLDICCSTSDNTDADMTHIATANPATVIALCDEVERLRHGNGMPLSMLGVDQLRQENDDLRREIERLRKDAERYRWLVAYFVSDRTDQDEAIVVASAIGVDHVTAVIDAAMEHKT